MDTNPCPVCGEAVPQREGGKGRQQVYCGRSCRDWAADHRRRAAGRICSLPGCTLPFEALELCHRHYTRFRKGLPLDAPIRPTYMPGQLCAWPTCDLPVVCQGYCDPHYRRWSGRVKKPMGAPVATRESYPSGAECKIDGCADRPVSGWLCSKHSQRAKDGRPMDLPDKRRYDPADRCRVEWCEKQAANNGYCVNHAARDHQLKSRYQLSVEAFLKLLAEQGGRCAVCGSDEPGGTGKTPLGFHVDHDHRCCPGVTSCGRCVRALLCNHCNGGHFDEDLDLMRRRLELNEQFRRDNPWIIEKRSTEHSR